MLPSLRFLLLPFLAVAAVPAARAQSANPAVWCPPGATWVYGYGNFTEVGTVTVSYARDTVVAGQPAQVLTRRVDSGFRVGMGAVVPGPPYQLSRVVTRVLGSRVEVLAHGQFHTLYDFAAPVGSSWLTPSVTPYGPCTQEQVRVVVDSVGRQQVGGRTLRWYTAQLTPVMSRAQLPTYRSGRIYEQVGSSSRYMQPQSPICHGTDPGYMGSLAGYRASGQPTVGTGPSGALLLGSGEARAGAAGFAAFPNPSAGQLALQLPAALHPAARLRLLDLSGRTLRETPAAAQLDVSGLPAGVYTLLLEQPGQAALASRVVRE